MGRIEENSLVSSYLRGGKNKGKDILDVLSFDLILPPY